MGEIEALAGCDRLTIAPALLDQLAKDEGMLARRLDARTVKPARKEKRLTEAAFRFGHNESAMATEKLAEGIRLFTVDLGKLRGMMAEKIG
jgi:transaldolase